MYASELPSTAILQATDAIPPSGLAVAADVAIVALGALAVVTVVVVVVLLFQIRKVGRGLRDTARAVEKNVAPVLDRSRGVAANLEFITAALRTDVERLNESIKALSARLQQASDHMEERIDEFNALMEVVQSEAEDVFIDTASAVRGIRAGARTLAEPGEEARIQPPGKPIED